MLKINFHASGNIRFDPTVQFIQQYLESYFATLYVQIASFVPLDLSFRVLSYWLSRCVSQIKKNETLIPYTNKPIKNKGTMGRVIR